MAIKDLLIKIGVKGNKKAKNDIQGLGKSFGAMAKSAAKVAGAFYAAKGVITGIQKTVEISSKLTAVEGGFRNLEKGIKGTGDTLKKLQEATNGTVNSIDLMTQANNAMLLGVFESKEQMAEAFDVAQRLGSALGKDTLFGVESLVTGMGRQSKLMLDNLGIMVDVEKANKEYADSLGISTTQLTDQQKKTAFNNATMKAAKELVNDLGEENLTTADRVSKLKASATNMAGELGQALTPAFNASLDVMASFSDNISEVVDVLSRVDFSKTASNVMKNVDSLLSAVGDTFMLLFDGLPESFSFVFGKIIPIAQGIFERLLSGIKNVAALLWEPVTIAAELMAAKVKNLFTSVFNTIKEQFNALADTWAGEKMGMDKLVLGDLIDTDAISAQFGETGLADLFGGESQVNNLNDFTEKSKEVWSKYFSTVAEMKAENTDIDNETNAINNENNLINQEEQQLRSLALSAHFRDEAIKQINQKAFAFQQAGVTEVDVQKFVSSSKSKLYAQESAAKADQLSSFFGMAKQASALEKKGGQRTKLLAKGEALVSAYSASAKTFTQFGGWPAGIVPAGIALALGLENVKAIDSQQFASGGIVQGQNIGQGDTVPAMLTPGELILNQAQQSNLAGKMSGVTINFNGPVTNDEYVKDFIIPEIQRTISDNLA